MWYDTLGKCVKKEGNLYRVNLICVSRLSRFISDFLFKQVTSKHRLHQFVSWRLSCSTGYMLTLLCWDRTSPSTSSRSDAGPLGSDHHIVTWDHTHLCLCFYLKNAPVQGSPTAWPCMSRWHRNTHRLTRCKHHQLMLSQLVMTTLKRSISKCWLTFFCLRQKTNINALWSDFHMLSVHLS